MKLDFRPVESFTSEPRDGIKIRGLLEGSELNCGIHFHLRPTNFPNMVLKNKLNRCYFPFLRQRRIMLRHLHVS